MMSTSSCVEKIFNTASGGRRSSPRFVNKSLELVERNLTTSIIKRNERKRQRLDDEKEESEVSIVPAKNVANGIEASKGSPAQIAPGTNAHYLVVKTLRTFNRHYLHFVQEEEQRVRGIVVNASMLKVDEGEDQIKKRGSKRPDLKAISKMLEDQAVLYPKKRIGHLPGIDVGHHFFSRAEMVALGLHSHWLNGIDYMGVPYGKMAEYSEYSFPLAICIVLSGMYEDDLDNSEDIIYTGQGGHDLLGNKRQIKDQKMERGNLALKNSMLHDVPVRVVRGHESASSYCGKVYTYDGLYKVHKYWAEKGVSGFTVFKYQLKRLKGQPALTTNQVPFIRAQVRQSISMIRGLVCEDISGGQENFPIPATNIVDDACFPPPGYRYCKSIQVAKGLKLPRNAHGCKCKGDCINPRLCACARFNGLDFPYVRRNGGRLIEAKAVVFECGPSCSCQPGCANRISQQGLKYHLEVFRTLDKGWAVRSWDTIPSGAPVCEYTGIIRRTDDMENVSENNFIFEIDCLQTMKGLDGREGIHTVMMVITGICSC
ncbi:unnamed protein product [Spirodela intermedia]|uniref:Uncharacterized protein n=1 Tax=Spirodela intermedia TaxID=51605 RepID=A0A811GA25_SPIIN|nr:unnamed protein product [Spirodela intermedia]